MSGASTATMELCVTHGKSKYTKTVPVTTTIHDVRQWLEMAAGVPVANQTLLFNAPVEKAHRKIKVEKENEGKDVLQLLSLLPKSLVEKLESSSTSAAPQVVKVNVMLLGTAENHAATKHVQLNTKTAGVLSRVVSITLEQDSQWFRCSYDKGYLRQTAYVCRTCVDEGRAAPDHALCLACTEVCHLNHNIEEWGVRYHMRCDCCTSKCWRKPTIDRSKENEEATSTPAKTSASVVTGHDVTERTKRKRSRSRSPIKSPVAPDGSPLMGIRVPAGVNTPSPFAINDPPGNEKEAVSSPIRSSVAASVKQPTGAPAFAGNRSPPIGLPFSEKPLSVEAPSSQPTPVIVTPSSPNTSGTKGPDGTPTSPQGLGVTPLPAFEGCRFILDSSTNKPPELIIPPNNRNRYPRKPLTWCYCEVDESGDEESGGLVCMLCTSCFWNTHITSVHSDQFRRVPCYGDVVQGDTVVFKCLTCDTHVCPPCRHRCHRDHEVEAECVVTSELAVREAEEEEKKRKQKLEEQRQGVEEPASARIPRKQEESKSQVESTAAGVQFSCGCRGLCSIAESISPHEVNDPSTFLPFSPETASEVMNSDIFTGFVCGHCMQENPWLLTEDFKKCWNGKLPEKCTASLTILPCKHETPSPLSSAEGVYPYHGMILPLNAFSEEMICSCAPCQQAFEKFMPWAREDASNMIMNLCDQCDVCHRSIRDKKAFLCRNCEMSMSDAFMLCAECNTHREKMVEASQRVIVARALPGEAPTSTDASTSSAPSLVQPTYTNSEGVEVTYEHDLSHQFMEDTQENLYALCGMQLVNAMEDEDREYLTEHWDEVQDMTPELTLQGNLGPTPIPFTQEELKEIAEVNAAVAVKEKNEEK